MTTTRPPGTRTGTARILATLSIPGILRSVHSGRRTWRTCPAGSSRWPAMSGLDWVIRPVAVAICANTSSLSMSVGRAPVSPGPCSCRSVASSSARELSPASTAASRSAPVLA